jgi:hypothetical protein
LGDLLFYAKHIIIFRGNPLYNYLPENGPYVDWRALPIMLLQPIPYPKGIPL